MTSAAPSEDPSRQPLLRAWTRIEELPTWVFIGWILTLLILRTGLSWGGTGELERFARNFPHPGTTFRSNSVLSPTIGWATGIHTRTSWVLLHAGLSIGWFVLTAWLLKRRVGSVRAWRVGLVWLTFFAAPASMLRRLGSYDVFTAIGVALVALPATPWPALFGGAIMGATNVEQGGIAVLCGALAFWAIPDAEGVHASLRNLASRFGAALAGLLAGRILVLVWFHLVGAHVEGRSDAFRRLLLDSLRNATSLGVTGVYAWLSVGWVIVIAALWQLRAHPRYCVAAGIGLVAIPAAATITTLDGSRVFAAVGGIALMLALLWFAQMATRREGEWVLSCSAALMLFGLLIPAVVTIYTGGIRIPWQFILNQ
ncbi:MAG: hypothetical protein WCJ04_12375 [Actinomycetes bacterium]